ncbi:protein SRG1-like [Juglans microcarpa x Juglans regia]|uniref:protein SRG1-like n=1 Tax=Juglans microcarpa x Juglans regia TaxID=2249226 RepID=UPI001B7E02A1|nr:protein SRG1-like [Juglans microcarpa x Juglans regia]
MEAQKTRFGSSPPVPFVQELAKDTASTVPPRYVRPDQDPSFISNSTALPQLPVIDMRLLFSQDFMDSELQKLHLASKQWGFFQLINHGVSSSLLEKVKSGIQELFNMDMEEKKKYWQGEGEGKVEGFGQSFVVSEEQKLDWGDMFFLITLPTYLRKSYLFPQLPLPLRDNLEAYSAKLKSLAMKILDQMAKALRMETNDMRCLFEEGMQSMRMNYYHPCPQPEPVIGISPHSDAVGLTILLQLNEIEDLQIRKDGMWIPSKPLPNAFVVNIGDILQIVMNAIYRSIEHRVTVNSKKERLSIATFLSPRLEGDFGPVPSLFNTESPALFKRIRVAGYLKGLFSRKLDWKSYVDTMRIQK